MLRLLFLLMGLCGFAFAADEDALEIVPKKIPLWPGGAPGALGVDIADQPFLTAWLVPRGSVPTTAVIVCPGGGYGTLEMSREGREIAQWLNRLGVSAFVLSYRLPPRYPYPVPLADARRAIRLLHYRADEFGISTDRIGLWGFSAGGHLASTAATHFDDGNYFAEDPVERKHSRPDFLILTYAVISFSSRWFHNGAQNGILARNFDTRALEELSNEKHVTPQTPPTFLFHTDADTGVPPENSVLFYLALRLNHVPAELHVYERGESGMGISPRDPTVATWPARLADWMRQRELLGRAVSVGSAGGTQ